MVLGGGDFGGRLGYEGGALLSGIRALEEEARALAVEEAGHL